MLQVRRFGMLAVTSSLTSLYVAHVVASLVAQRASAWACHRPLHLWPVHLLQQGERETTSVLHAMGTDSSCKSHEMRDPNAQNSHLLVVATSCTRVRPLFCARLILVSLVCRCRCVLNAIYTHRGGMRVSQCLKIYSSCPSLSAVTP